MELFYDLDMNFLKRQSVSCAAVNGVTESSQMSLKISSFVFLKMNESLTGLKQH